MSLTNEIVLIDIPSHTEALLTMAAAELLSKNNSIADFCDSISERNIYQLYLYKYFRGSRRSIWVSVLDVNSGCIALSEALCKKELKDIEGKSSRGTLKP